MRWRDGNRSDNVIDGRGSGSGLRFGGGLSLGGIALVVGIGLLMGRSPLEMLALIAGSAPPATQQAPAGNDESVDFVRAILGETEQTWGDLFAQAGQRYPAPKLVLFSGWVQSACGSASAATGPFYCPPDQRVYLDMSFFDDMRTRLGGGGDFAYAYVIAHEVGHHVQNLTGISERVQAAGRGAGAKGLSVRQELQADCYAGVWAHHAQARLHWLEPGDVEEALATATAIGDDRLQKQAQGRVTPDSFTHGSSEQRVRWFQKGFDSGAVGACDTFAAAAL